MNASHIRSAYLSLGSNSHDAKLKLLQALDEIANLSCVQIELISPLFETEPQDFKQQNWFCNQCLKLRLDESWTAETFLRKMQEIEAKLGRKRLNTQRFGPRPIDLDLLIFGAERSTREFCRLPHPRMHKRAFVLLPLYIIEPELRLYGHKLIYWLSLLQWQISGNKIWQK